MADTWLQLDVPSTNHAAAPAAPSYAVRLLTREDPDDWRWLPAVCARLAAFCAQYEQQADAQALVRTVQQAFVMDDPGMVCLAFWRDDALIGHMLCDRAILYYRPIVTVHQYALDHGVPAHVRHDAIALVKAWGTAHGADQIQFLVRNKELAALYKRFFGAQPHLLLMRVAIEEDESHGRTSDGR